MDGCGIVLVENDTWYFRFWYLCCSFLSDDWSDLEMEVFTLLLI